mmetsp:Transcript_20216/g.23390  ORF Transcript_20216/g.23390 Transcript_20216/m.23390 type:complete len:153 (+) Transcript_20216:166-624(+)|eukprot:CAMPEP_0168330954 /NCGR_PEP_ID=MMETSP0213-20121227/8045_1 /TAXON_ID=151035 /ORGANISM="Euplotes harpa, Strain FSP1.4" /LENGTH=152 /DNA_ID=CAMNT_0008334637 /DNA_START=163 /DNA_END=621 /DNA_ORIENTATION=+
MGSTQLYRDNDRIEQTSSKYNNSRRADVVLDVSFESRNNTIIEKDEQEEEKFQHLLANEDEDFSEDKLEKRECFGKAENLPTIANILHKRGKYWIYNTNEDFFGEPEDLIWITIRDYRDSASSLGYKLNVDDIVKFGRARLRITKIKIDKKE